MCEEGPTVHAGQLELRILSSRRCGRDCGTQQSQFGVHQRLAKTGAQIAPTYFVFWKISESMMIEISSPIIAAGYLAPTPKSWRLIFVLALMPIRWLPRGSLIGALGPSTSRATS